MSVWIISMTSTILIFFQASPLSWVVVWREFTPRATFTFSPSWKRMNLPASTAASMASRVSRPTSLTSGRGA